MSEINTPRSLPLLPVRDIVVCPFMSIPLVVGREASIKAVEAAWKKKNKLILLATQKEMGDEAPDPEEIYSVGTVAAITRTMELEDGRLQILVQGLFKAKIVEFLATAPHFVVRIESLEESEPGARSKEVTSLIRKVKRAMVKIAPLKDLPPELTGAIRSINHPGRLADIVVTNLRPKIEQAQEIFEILDPVERLRKVNDLVAKELEVSSMQHRIETETREELNQDQRENFLREQMQAILNELGEVDDRTREINELREEIKKAKMPPEVEKEAQKQLRRLSRMHQDVAEAAVVRNYMDWLVELPWSRSTRDNLNLSKAKRVLDEDHYDLEKVKERILEYLSVCKLKKRMKGPILCFVGPPGVGKTSLGRSIARAMGRKFVRMSLGGIRDEAEIRGHRRTYVGALPGRIIQGIKEAGSNNPVFMMDEVDKIGSDFRGDPSSALLEVLDPEQNSAFSDHYLNLPFDLSKVMFLTTANITDPIPPALLDRMEIISLPGYTDEEKLKICKEFLLPRQLEANGLKPSHVVITDAAILHIISDYTKEAGLRNLEREVATICRKVARSIAEERRKGARITRANVHKYLGSPKYLKEGEQEESEVGVVTGLAWTQTGGETLQVEVTTLDGSGDLTITGQLGDVMKESAQAALSYIRSRARELGVKENFLDKMDIHIHVPMGAIPKDGPSAGITIATALISALTRTPVDKNVALTGEITLRGRVLPVGGLKEKALAALRAKMGTIVLPDRNRKDLDDIPKDVRRKLNFVFANRMDQVLPATLINYQKNGKGAAHKRAPILKN